MVECDLAKVEVAGSNPVSRSMFWKKPQRGFACFCGQVLVLPSGLFTRMWLIYSWGAVPKW